jgi:exosome complex component RRP42
MAPQQPSQTQTLLSPAELNYLYTSLGSTPPIRPDGRSPTQFRPLIAETDVLPGTNGSARICFADGTEAIVGVKAEVEKSAPLTNLGFDSDSGERMDVDIANSGDKNENAKGKSGKGDPSWVDLTIEIPGFRDDDALPVFLASLLSEALLGTGDLVQRLWINERWHWRLYIDVCLSLSLFFSLVFLFTTTSFFSFSFSFYHIFQSLYHLHK